MKPHSRKEREVQQREERFLDIAQQMLLEKGYLGVNMDRIADATEYSKGTLYQHFANKEDLIAALLLRTVRVREGLFLRASLFRGGSRERITAIGVADGVFTRLFPDHDRIERAIKVESVWDKASEARRLECTTRDNNCMSIVQGIIRDGIAADDLRLPVGVGPEVVMFGLWSMAVGARLLIHHGIIDTVGISDAEPALNACYQTYLDGFGWRPLSSDLDYVDVVKRIHREVFSEEAAQIGLVLTETGV